MPTRAQRKDTSNRLCRLIAEKEKIQRRPGIPKSRTIRVRKLWGTRYSRASQAALRMIVLLHTGASLQRPQVRSSWVRSTLIVPPLLLFLFSFSPFPVPRRIGFSHLLRLQKHDILYAICSGQILVGNDRASGGVFFVLPSPSPFLGIFWGPFSGKT